MDKLLEQLPEPNLKGIKISLLKKTDKQQPLHVSHLDSLLDKKFIDEYFKEKITKEYIDER